MSEIGVLRAEIERLWCAYLDPHITDRERRQVGWRIDAAFERIRHDPVWQEVFLSTDWLGD
jgi:hypothetical protein